LEVETKNPKLCAMCIEALRRAGGIKFYDDRYGNINVGSFFLPIYVTRGTDLFYH